MSLTQSLERLVDIFESRGMAMRQHLRLGLRRADIEAALDGLGLVAPEELYELYEWHDGVDILNAPEMFFAQQQFIPLSEAVQEYHYNITYYSDVPSSINLTQCFPFAFFEGDCCTIYCEPTLVLGLQHPVISVYEGIGPIYENIERMTQTVSEWFVSGAYDTDAPVDSDLLYAIRKRLNPRINYEAQI